MRTTCRFVTLVAFVAFSAPGSAAHLLVDQGLRVAGLWCYPLADNPDQYFYVPNSARLVRAADGTPQFSLLLYGEATSADAGDVSGTSESEGGGILTMMVEYDTPDRAVALARSRIARAVGRDSARLVGPLIFDSGKYALVSASTEGAPVRLAEGRAPVIEGGAVAISMKLTPRQAGLVLTSMDMAATGLTLVFEMEFSGVSDAYDAKMTVYWDKVHDYFSAGGDVKVYYVGAKVDVAISKLLNNSAITLKSRGDDAAMDAMLNSTYAKVLDMLFAPMPADEAPQQQASETTNSLMNMNAAASQAKQYFSISGYYKRKDVRTSGESTMIFSKQMPITLNSTIVFDAGTNIARLADDDRFVRQIDLKKTLMTQKDIVVELGVGLRDEFLQFINSVTIEIRKEHAGGQATQDQITIGREAFSDDKVVHSLSYLRYPDEEERDWQAFQYRTLWRFSDGGQYNTDWRDETTGRITLNAPYMRSELIFAGNFNQLVRDDVRVIFVDVRYPIFAEVREDRFRLVPSSVSEHPDQTTIDIIVPDKFTTFEYEVVHVKGDQSRTTFSGTSPDGFIFVDPPIETSSEGT